VPSADTIMPPGTELPSIDDDPDLAEELDEYDGVDGLIPRLNAFANGAPVRAWDFGPAPPFAAPVYRLVKRSGEDLVFVPHNPLVDSLPGDPGYSPYERPASQPLAIDCPIVASDVRLEVGGGEPPMAPPRRFNVRGFTVAYYDFGLMAVDEDRVRVPDVRRYVVRREGGEPISEPLRGVDMTGDGDTNDTNDIYVRTLGERPTPRCRTVSVAVPAATESIDTHADETMAALRDAEQLFDPDPVAGTVVAYTITDEVRHCVFQREDGGL
jgi:hypothetical protein